MQLLFACTNAGHSRTNVMGGGVSHLHLNSEMNTYSRAPWFTRNFFLWFVIGIECETVARVHFTVVFIISPGG